MNINDNWSKKIRIGKLFEYENYKFNNCWLWLIIPIFTNKGPRALFGIHKLRKYNCAEKYVITIHVLFLRVKIKTGRIINA